MISVILSILVSAAFAQQAEVITCASTNSADKGAYELKIIRSVVPAVEEAWILVDDEPLLFFKGRYSSGYMGFSFESLAKVNPNLPELEVEAEDISCYSCDRKFRARVTLNNPDHEKIFTETGLRRMQNLICK